MIQKTKYLTLRQSLLLASLKGDAVEAYFKSFLGEPYTYAKPAKVRAPLITLDERISYEGEMANRDENTPRILKALKTKYDIFDETTSLKPTERSHPIGKCVGIEIECFAPVKREAMRRLLQQHKIKLKYVKCGSDPTIKSPPDHWPYEFRVMSNMDDMSNLESLCKFLRLIHADVNASCGLHIHLDMRAYEKLPAFVINNFKHGLDLLKRMVPAPRLNGYNYMDVDHNHNCKINIGAFDEHRTVEVRMHTPTTNYEKIVNWIKVCNSIARHQGAQIDSNDIQDYAVKLNWDQSLLKYVNERVNKFMKLDKKHERILTQDNEYMHDAQVNYEEVA